MTIPNPARLFEICASSARNGPKPPRPKPYLHAPYDADTLTKGHWVESVFQTRVIALGFAACRPWGTHALDLIISRFSTTLRVQVKSAWELDGYCYSFMVAHNRTPKEARRRRTYTPKEVDFIAGMVVPLDAWYIIPISEILPGQEVVRVYPLDGRIPLDVNGNPRKRRHFNYEHFREAWSLLR